WSCTVASATEASCTLASLAVGAAAPVTVQATVDAGAASGTYTSSAQVSASTGDPNPGNNLADEETTVNAAGTDLIFANGFECAAGLPGCATTPVVLFDEFTNRFVTAASGGPGNAPISAVQSSLSMTLFGAGSQVGANNWVADDFVVPAGGWTIQRVKVYSYQTGSTTTPTHNDLRLRIWSNDPNTGTLVFGDTTTNRLSSVTFSGVYRVTQTTPTDATRPVMELVAEINPPLVLPAGTYWLGWSAGGTLASGPWAPPQTVVGQATTGNGVQSLNNAAFAPLLDAGSNTQQGFPLVLEGN
ncbi:MAG: hypothetical protein U0S76_12485, partial [Pseudoxanthomonas sp.]|nr:hypothetical protein [Pseudoxanthomonas sp.]